ncbi:MAG TPA: nucleotidyltransferase domain-containing protein [bacterium]|nr:nucleotidyltransferase domain-containing protein [bacterium]
MVALSGPLRSRIAEVCQRYQVRRLELFGSAAREGVLLDGSDVDLLVSFEDREPGPRFGTYFRLRQELEALLGRPVDLVMPEAITNPYIQADIARDRTVLYGA